MADVFGGMVAALSGVKVDLNDREKDRFLGRACNSEGVSESWADQTVREGRLTRDGVQVTLPSGEVRAYKSTREAFRNLRLPDNQHIRFRLKLKAERVHTFTTRDGREYRFGIVPRD
ncbi:hypothetical protein [Paraburkholderia strydomiana]|uniref:hypothetical protein n=1 Tax=Paraburkholderia strydomiana TaxID=1245417 RepID=UPI0038BAE484